MQKSLTDKIRELPSKPGVYIFKDAKGLFLYVGKAINLRNRVSSYFKKNAGQGSPRIQNMIAQIADMDYTVTGNELESLVLENNFIKQLQPKYNVRLRDDKNYLFLKIKVKDEIPTIEYDRKPNDRGARYFGPYTSSLSVKDTLRLLRTVFPYCSNSRVGTKPCFYYHIGKCPGVCIGKITLEEYRVHYVNKIIQFLEGRQSEVLKDLQEQMRYWAKCRKFEKAAQVRNQIFALNRVLERQRLVDPKKTNQDIFSLHCEHVASINLFIIRDGKLTQKENFIVENTKNASPAEILETFLAKYYLDASSIPKEIILPIKINEEGLAILLNARVNNPSQPPLILRGGVTAQKPPLKIRGGEGELRSKHKIKIVVPTRGTKLKLMQLGEENARQYLEAQTDKHLLEEARLLSALKELQRVLDLPKIPARMECYDISNIQGSNAVGSMVVFDFGKPKKTDYRKFKINRKQTPDDFAMMKEMLERRFAHSRQTTTDKRQPDWPLPDLVIIDGGRGQLNAALNALQKSNIKSQIPTIGLAKRLEEIFLPGRSEPVLLPRNSIALFLLQRVRDEAHRFAVKYHRLLRSKSSVRSALDDIPGLGPAKKRKLLEQFGSPAKIKTASLTEIARIAGASLAEKIKASL